MLFKQMATCDAGQLADVFEPVIDGRAVAVNDKRVALPDVVREQARCRSLKDGCSLSVHQHRAVAALTLGPGWPVSAAKSSGQCRGALPLAGHRQRSAPVWHRLGGAVNSH